MLLKELQEKRPGELLSVFRLVAYCESEKVPA